MSVSGPRRRLVAFVVAMAIVIVTPLAVTANDAFVDVPESNVHHDNITWLRDTGVTVGCNPPANTQYCPEDSVSRAQMATFMRRLAENQVVDAATAVTAQSAANAESLGGLPASSYVSSSSADLDGGQAGTFVSAETELNSLTISVPEDGILVVSGSAFISESGAVPNLFGLRPSVDGDLISGPGGNAVFDVFAAGEAETLSYTVAFAVTAGTHAVAQTASALDPIAGLPTAGDFFYNANNLTVQWHPEGTVTLSIAAADSGSITGPNE